MMPRQVWRVLVAAALLVAALVLPSMALARANAHDVRLPRLSRSAHGASLPRLSRMDGVGLFIRALHLEHGDAGAPDPQQALALYCEAGARGEPRAYVNIGWIYLRGKAVHRDVAIASAWL